MDLLKIAGGTIYDPTNGVDGEVRDLWISDGKIVPPPTDPAVRPSRTIDARGYAVLAGGIDMHAHLAGPKVNAGRRLRPELAREGAAVSREQWPRSGRVCSVPSTFAAGYLYTTLGITAAFDAAIPPLFARHAHEEFDDTPIIDKGFLALVGNDHYVLERVREKDDAGLENYLGWLLGATKAFGLKAVNPGAVEHWKQTRASRLCGMDGEVTGFSITPREIVERLSAAADRLKLSHSLHVHGPDLGLPGASDSLADLIEAFGGNRGHLAHVQFHSYAATGGRRFASDVSRLVETLAGRPEITLDVGHVTFGDTTSMTGDGALGHYLAEVTKNKWFSGDTELQAGCGIVPITYRRGSLTHAVQWAIGLEWYLLMNDPWRVALSTDHPNGGTFLRYPETIALLMSKERRREAIANAHPKLVERTTIADLDREYSLYEIAILTRSAPARILGLSHKGRLDPGADADVAILSIGEDLVETFARPRYVLKAGRVVAEDGCLVRDLEPELAEGETAYSAPAVDSDQIERIRRWHESRSTVCWENFPVEADRPRRARLITP